jgi:hypothetical protein
MYVHTEWSVNLTINYEELGAKFFTQKKTVSRIGFGLKRLFTQPEEYFSSLLLWHCETPKVEKCPERNKA